MIFGLFCGIIDLSKMKKEKWRYTKAKNKKIAKKVLTFAENFDIIYIEKMRKEYHIYHLPLKNTKKVLTSGSKV